jgi:hypothetical protein
MHLYTVVLGHYTLSRHMYYWCMYVCMYVCMFAFMYVCMYVCMYAKWLSRVIWQNLWIKKLCRPWNCICYNKCAKLTLPTTRPLPPLHIYSSLYIIHVMIHNNTIHSKTCLKRNAIVPVFFFSVFTGFRFTNGCVLIKQSTKNMIA